ncbi:MAG TPA: hypothetical protein VJB63_03185 [Patescibacteria group bacterium]|nr:hypothetical protein [Patescibacteria group bacterium]
MSKKDSFIRYIANEIKIHIFEYLLLTTIAVFFVFLLSLFKGESQSQFIIMVFFAITYLAWGIIHHIIHHTFHLKIVIEYILIAALGIFLLQILLLL